MYTFVQREYHKHAVAYFYHQKDGEPAQPLGWLTISIDLGRENPRMWMSGQTIVPPDVMQHAVKSLIEWMQGQ